MFLEILTLAMLLLVLGLKYGAVSRIVRLNQNGATLKISARDTSPF